MTGDLLIRMSGQGAVYIREVHNLSDGQCSDVNDSEDDALFLSPFDDPDFNVESFFGSIDHTGIDETGKCIVPRTYFAHLQRN